MLIELPVGLKGALELAEKEGPARPEVVAHHPRPLLVRVVDDLAIRAPEADLVAGVELVVLAGPPIVRIGRGLGLLEPDAQQEVARRRQDLLQVVEELEQLGRGVPVQRQTD